MKMTRYSEPQILAILRQALGGVPVSFYKWRSKYGGMPSRQIAMQSHAG
jgi:putative transposase